MDWSKSDDKKMFFVHPWKREGFVIGVGEERENEKFEVKIHVSLWNKKKIENEDNKYRIVSKRLVYKKILILISLKKKRHHSQTSPTEKEKETKL